MASINFNFSLFRELYEKFLIFCFWFFSICDLLFLLRFSRSYFMVTCRSLLNFFLIHFCIFCGLSLSLARLIDFFLLRSFKKFCRGDKEIHSLRLWSAVKKKEEKEEKLPPCLTRSDSTEEFILARELMHRKCSDECLLWVIKSDLKSSLKNFCWLIKRFRKINSVSRSWGRRHKQNRCGSIDAWIFREFSSISWSKSESRDVC